MSSFVPLVFNTSGGIAPTATVTFKRIAALLSEKWSMPYSSVMGWIKCRLSFAPLQGSVMCLCGSRKHAQSANVKKPDLAHAEGRFFKEELLTNIFRQIYLLSTKKIRFLVLNQIVLLSSYFFPLFFVLSSRHFVSGLSHISLCLVLPSLVEVLINIL